MSPDVQGVLDEHINARIDAEELVYRLLKLAGEYTLAELRATPCAYLVDALADSAAKTVELWPTVRTESMWGPEGPRPEDHPKVHEVYAIHCRIPAMRAMLMQVPKTPGPPYGTGMVS